MIKEFLAGNVIKFSNYCLHSIHVFCSIIKYQTITNIMLQNDIKRKTDIVCMREAGMNGLYPLSLDVRGTHQRLWFGDRMGGIQYNGGWKISENFSYSNSNYSS